MVRDIVRFERTFEDLLADPNEQFDPASELLRSIAAYSEAPGSAASATRPRLHAVRRHRTDPRCRQGGAYLMAVIVVDATGHPQRDDWVDEQAEKVVAEARPQLGTPGPYHGVHPLPSGMRVHVFGPPEQAREAIKAWAEH